jgi:hypothetical protein
MANTNEKDSLDEAMNDAFAYYVGKEFNMDKVPKQKIGQYKKEKMPKQMDILQGPDTSESETNSDDSGYQLEIPELKASRRKELDPKVRFMLEAKHMDLNSASKRKFFKVGELCQRFGVRTEILVRLAITPTQFVLKLK